MSSTGSTSTGNSALPGLQGENFEDRFSSSRSNLIWWVTLLVSSIGSSVVLTAHLVEFPLYFFCDEAIHGVEAQSLLQRGTDQYGDSWPLFFRGYGTFHLSLSVYFQLPFEYLIGHSEFSIRFRNVIVSLIGGIGAALLISRIDRRFLVGAAAPLVFTASSFWFLHARTGFEFMISASAWIWMIVSYDGSLRFGGWRAISWIVVLLVSYCAAFYSYTPARGWASLTLVLLFLAYLPLQLKKRWRTVLIVCGCAAIVVPFAIKAMYDPQVAFGRLQDMGVRSSSAITPARLMSAWNNLLDIIDPRYWFFWNGHDFFESSERHLVPEQPLLPLYIFPFAIVGVLVLLVRMKSCALSRALFLLIPVGAFPAVFVATNPLRCIPIGIAYLFIGIAGMSWLSWKLCRYLRVQGAWQSVTAILLMLPTYQTYEFALTRAPYLYHDYTFYGVQSGAPQIFDWIKVNLPRFETIIMGNEAFNGNDVLENFYLNPKERRGLMIAETSPACILESGNQNGTWILRSGTWDRLNASDCPVSREVLTTFNDPNGKPLFYVAKLAAQGTLPAWIRAREEERLKPVSSTVVIGGKAYPAIHSGIDTGELAALFDGDLGTIVRSNNINPLKIELMDLGAQHISAIRVVVRHCVKSTVEVQGAFGESNLQWGKQSLEGRDDMCDFTFTRQSPTKLDSVSISVGISGADNRVHLAELELR